MSTWFIASRRRRSQDRRRQAGIMVQIPHEFILLQGIAVPEKGRYGCGLVFLPHDEDTQQIIFDIIEREAIELGLTLIAVRDIPTNNEQLGPWLAKPNL